MRELIGTQIPRSRFVITRHLSDSYTYQLYEASEIDAPEWRRLVKAYPKWSGNASWLYGHVRNEGLAAIQARQGESGIEDCIDICDMNDWMLLVFGERSPNLVPVGTLLDWGQFTILETLEFLSFLSCTVAAMHDSGVVHRSLCMSSVLWRRRPDSNRLLITDFSGAFRRSSFEPDSRSKARNDGFFRYRAPEDIGEYVDNDSAELFDVYAFGRFAYDLSAGCIASDSAFCYWPLPTGYLYDFRRELPPELAKIVEACLAPTPESRPRMREVSRIAQRTYDDGFEWYWRFRSANLRVTPAPQRSYTSEEPRSKNEKETVEEGRGDAIAPGDAARVLPKAIATWKPPKPSA